MGGLVALAVICLWAALVHSNLLSLTEFLVTCLIVAVVLLSAYNLVRVIGMRRLRSVRYKYLMLVGGLLVMAGISLGLGLLDVADDPQRKNAFLYHTWVRMLVDERWWAFGLASLLAYFAYLGLAVRRGRPSLAFLWKVPVELVVLGVVAVVTALVLFWFNLHALCIVPGVTEDYLRAQYGC